MDGFVINTSIIWLHNRIYRRQGAWLLWLLSSSPLPNDSWKTINAAPIPSRKMFLPNKNKSKTFYAHFYNSQTRNKTHHQILLDSFYLTQLQQNMFNLHNNGKTTKAKQIKNKTQPKHFYNAQLQQNIPSNRQQVHSQWPPQPACQTLGRVDFDSILFIYSIYK